MSYFGLILGRRRRQCSHLYRAFFLSAFSFRSVLNRLSYILMVRHRCKFGIAFWDRVADATVCPINKRSLGVNICVNAFFMQFDMHLCCFRWWSCSWYCFCCWSCWSGCCCCSCCCYVSFKTYFTGKSRHTFRKNLLFPKSFPQNELW